MHLTPTLVDVLERERWPIVAVDAEAHILHTNGAWDAAARADGAPECLGPRLRGRSWLAAIHGPQRDYHARLLASALAQRPGPRQPVLTHVSECNTPGRVRRLVSRFTPLALEGERPRAVLICAWLQDAGARAAAPPDVAAAFSDARGLVVQCGCCRRVRAPAGAEWHHVPALVARSAPHTSHSLCDLCLELYYGEPLLHFEPSLEAALQAGPAQGADAAVCTEPEALPPRPPGPA